LFTYADFRGCLSELGFLDVYRFAYPLKALRIRRICKKKYLS
jgi:hypothetical protein